eukprot:12803932-Ditylum_brightwellii.AAC.1
MAGGNSFYTRPYAKIGRQSKGFSIQSYEVNWTSKIIKAFNLLHCNVGKGTLPYQQEDKHCIAKMRWTEPWNGMFR